MKARIICIQCEFAEGQVEVFPHWSYAVKTVAINAVMAGMRPEYLPVLLAVASTGKEALSVSDNSLTTTATAV